MKQKISKISQTLAQVSIFLIPFYFFRFSIGPIPTNMFEISVLFAFLCTVYRVLCTRSKFKFGLIWPYLFLLISFASIFPAADKTTALGIFKGWFLVPFALYWTILNSFEKDEIFKILTPFFYSSAIIGIWGLAQSLGLVTTLFYQKGDPSFAQYLTADNFRIFGPFESPNFLAMYLAPAIFLSLVWARRRLTVTATSSYVLQTSIFVIYLILIFDLLQTGSRAGLLALFTPVLVVTFFQALSSFKSNLPKKFSSAAHLLLVFLLMLFTYQTAAVGRGESNIQRVQIWHYSLEIISKHPIFGIGLGSFQAQIATVAKDNADFISNTLSYALHPHNVYLAMWLNLGILGLIIFLIFVVKFFALLIPHRKNLVAVCLMAAMSAILVHGLFDTTYFKNDLAAIFWLIIALSEIFYVKKTS